MKTYVCAARTTMDFYNADALQRRILRGVLREKGKFSRERPVFEVHHLEAVLSFFDSDCYMDCLCRFAFVLLALSSLLPQVLHHQHHQGGHASMRPSRGRVALGEGACGSLSGARPEG